jgi:hypothetical protein
MNITDNNVIYDKDDAPLKQGEQAPLRLISNLEQLYPVGTVCNINLTSEGNHHTIFLSAQLRLEAEWTGPHDATYLSLVSGSTIKAESLSQFTKQYD